MTKFFILIILFNIFSCEKEVIKKDVSPTLTSIPDIQPEEKEVLVDSVLLNAPDNKTLQEFYKSTGYKIVWKSTENRKTILQQLLNSEEDGLNPADYNIRTNCKNTNEKLSF